MTANVYDSARQLICTLVNVVVNHIESNAYRISGYTDSHFLTTDQLSNVDVDIINQGQVVRTFHQGCAINIQGNRVQGQQPMTYITIDALE